MYKEEFKRTMREDQKGKKSSYYKSCTETKMRRKAGSSFLANAIWQIGLPRLPPFATEQQGKQLPKQALEAVPEAVRNVLQRFGRMQILRGASTVVRMQNGTNEK